MVGNRCNYGGIMTSLDPIGIFSQVSDGGVMKFVPLNQGKRVWKGMCAAPNGDVYACSGSGVVVTVIDETNIPKERMSPTVVLSSTVTLGNIFKQTGGTGDFVSLNQQALNWEGLYAAPNGDIYALSSNGPNPNASTKWKQTGGAGDFEQTSDVVPLLKRQVWAYVDTPTVTTVDNDVYTTHLSGYTTGSCLNKNGTRIFDFNYLIGLWAAPNGDVWVSAHADAHYLEDGVSPIINRGLFLIKSADTSFMNTGEKGRSWTGMAFAPNGDIYACVAGHNINPMTLETWNFDMYYGSDIYKLMEI